VLLFKKPKFMNTKDPQREAKKHQLQMDIVVKDGDCKKIERKKMELDIVIRQMRKKQQELMMEVSAKEREMSKLHGEHLMALAEIKKMKNQLNLL